MTTDARFRTIMRFIAILLTATCCGFSATEAAPTYVVEDLGVLPGDTESIAVAVNASGKAVGRSKPTGGFFKAVLWDTATPTNLATLIGQQTSFGGGINDAGNLTTLAGFISPGSSTGTTAHFWNATTLTLTDIGKIGTGTPQGFHSSIGNAVNNSDQVVGNAWASNADLGEYHGFSWKAGVLKDLGLLSGCNQSEAWDVNNSGQIVGRAWGGCFTPQALVWTSDAAAPVSINSVFAGIGEITNIQIAAGINDSGSVLAQRVESGKGRCLIFNATPPTKTELGGIGDNAVWIGETCVPGKINNLGEAVARQVGAKSIALLFSGGVLYDLNTVLDPVSAAAWELRTAEDINDSGTIIGQGLINGELHAYRAVRTGGGAITVSDSQGAVDDRNLPFGVVSIGVGTIGTVTVTNNTGSAAAIGITDNLAAPFGIFDPQDCTAVDLPANTSCTMTITYDPVAAVASGDSLTLDLAGTPAVVTVSGTGRLATTSVTDSILPADDRIVPFAGTVVVGGSGTATVTVRNTDLVAVNVSVTEGLAGPFSFLNPGACNTTLAPTQTCTLTVVFSPTVAGPVNDTFTLLAAGAPVTVTVTGAPGVPNADMQVTQAADNPVIQPGVSGSDQTTFTLTVTNNGPDGANATVTDLLASGFVFISPATASQGSYNAATGVWDVGALGNGAQATLRITALATPSLSGCVANTATVAVTGPAGAVDPVGGNNGATLYIGAPLCADVTMAVTAATAATDFVSFSLQTHVTTKYLRYEHHIQVVNNGPGVATGVILDVTAYSAVTGVEPLYTNLAPGPRTIPIGTLAVGETRSVLIAAYEAPQQHIDENVNVAVNVLGAEPDPVPANNSSAGSYLYDGSTGNDAAGGGTCSMTGGAKDDSPGNIFGVFGSLILMAIGLKAYAIFRYKRKTWRNIPS